MANKIAVVTGGAGGIGHPVVARLAQSGFGVCILDQNDRAGQEFVEQLRKDKCAKTSMRPNSIESS